MNPDIVIQSLQKGFRTTVGAAAFLVDLVQYPEQRDENLSRLRTDFNQLTEEWAVKGEKTEQEARSFVENLLQQQATGQTGGNSSSTAKGPVAPPNIQDDLKDLTAQIQAIRAELEKLRQQNP